MNWVKAVLNRLWSSDVAQRAWHTLWQTFAALALGAVVADASGVHVSIPVLEAAAFAAIAAALSVLKGAVKSKLDKGV